MIVDLQKKRVNLSPPQWIMLVFLALIGGGALLLALPHSSATGVSVGILDALFISASAVCVNGLAVLDIGSTFSPLGEGIIIVLIQIGGLGFMTLGVMVAILLGKRISLKQRLILQQTTQSNTTQGMVKLSLYIMLISLAFEALATVILTLRWQGDMGWGRAFYYGVFHSISAFNNAGLALWPDSLSSYVTDPVVNLTITGLFIIGGLGFIVIVDVFRKRSWRKLSLHSKVVLLTSAVLSVGAILFILFFESWNPATLGSMPWPERIWAAYFQGLTPRSGGFNTIDIGSMLGTSQFFMIILMFIGASSGGTGGGIKTNTLIVLILATVNTFRGGQIHAFRRKINPDTVMRALAVTISSMACVLLVTLLLTVTEGIHDRNFLEILFESVSAFSTTGLSMGLTWELSSPGKVIIAITMFVGRLGPLTLAYALSQRKDTSKIGYPEDHILIG